MMKNSSIKSIAFFFLSLICFSSWAQYGTNSMLGSSQLRDDNLIEAIRAVKPENIKNLSDAEISVQVLTNANEYYGVNVSIDERIHKYAGLDYNQILPQAVKDGLITNLEAEIIEEYTSVYVSDSRENALRYLSKKNETLKNKVVKERMDKLFKIYSETQLLIDYTDTESFQKSGDCSWFRCALATTALVAATAAVAGGAVTIGGAILAVVLHANAVMAFVEKCGPCGRELLE